MAYISWPLCYAKREEREEDESGRTTTRNAAYRLVLCSSSSLLSSLFIPSLLLVWKREIDNELQGIYSPRREQDRRTQTLRLLSSLNNDRPRYTGRCLGERGRHRNVVSGLLRAPNRYRCPEPLKAIHGSGKEQRQRLGPLLF